MSEKLEPKPISISADDQRLILLLVKCAEEKFDKARVVQEEEITCLAAAQRIKSLVKLNAE